MGQNIELWGVDVLEGHGDATPLDLLCRGPDMRGGGTGFPYKHLNMTNKTMGLLLDSCYVLAADDAGYWRSFDTDAVTKANHFCKCGAATKLVPPNIMHNYAGPEPEVRALERDGKLSLKSYVDTCDDLSHPSPADDPLPNDDSIRDYSSSLHCARNEAPTSGAGRVTCMVSSERSVRTPSR